MYSIHDLRKDFSLDRLVRFMESRKPVDDAVFEAGEVVSLAYILSVPFAGRLLRVPPCQCAVLVHPSGRTGVYTTGDHYLNLPPFNYPLYFVDLHQQTLSLAEVRAPSQDAWDVSLALDIVWQVSSPQRVLEIRRIVELLTSACRSVVADYIRSMPHDLLVCVPGRQPVPAEVVTGGILAALRRSRSIRGIDFLDIFIQDRQGDRRRTEAVQQATVEKTVIEQEKLLQEVRTELKAQALSQEMTLLKEKEAVAIQEALIARRQAEEQDLLRVTMADHKAQEAQRLWATLCQEIELRKMADEQQIRHTETMKSMEVRGQIISQIATALLQVPALSGMQRMVDEDSRAEVAKLLAALLNTPAETSIPAAAIPGSSGPGGSREPPPAAWPGPTPRPGKGTPTGPRRPAGAPGQD